MQFLAYLLIYPFLWIISILPFRVLYLFSDMVYILVFYIVGYRKKTVWNNLTLVFPEKTDSEIKIIRKKFYKHLCDMFLEMIKSMTISKEELKKRFVIKNPDELKRLEGLDKSIITMYGHYASYEWSMVIENYTCFKGLGVYKTIANPYFDDLVKRIRSKYNTLLIDMKKAAKELMYFEQKEQKTITAFLSDQSPKLKKTNHWIKFMNIQVPCFTGAELLAKRLDFSVTFLKISKVKRGFYEAEFIPLSDNPKQIDNYKITEWFYQKLEKQIVEAPEYYLWTHKRWKHKDDAPETLQ